MNDLCFTAKNQKGLHFNHFCRKCISSDTKWLNIINAKHCISSLRSFFCTLMRDDMQKRARESLFLMICTQASCVMICHYSVMDKKRLQFCIKITVFFDGGSWVFTKGEYFSPCRLQASLVSLRFGHARGKTTLSCFLTLSRRFATRSAAQM